MNRSCRVAWQLRAQSSVTASCSALGGAGMNRRGLMVTAHLAAAKHWQQCFAMRAALALCQSQQVLLRIRALVARAASQSVPPSCSAAKLAGVSNQISVRASGAYVRVGSAQCGMAWQQQTHVCVCRGFTGLRVIACMPRGARSFAGAQGADC